MICHLNSPFFKSIICLGEGCAHNSSAVQVRCWKQAEFDEKCNTYIYVTLPMHDQSLFRKEREKLYIILYHLDLKYQIFSFRMIKDSNSFKYLLFLYQKKQGTQSQAGTVEKNIRHTRVSVCYPIQNLSSFPGDFPTDQLIEKSQSGQLGEVE